MNRAVDVAIIGGGPGGMQAAIELGTKGIDAILVDRQVGKPDAPDGIVTIPRRCEMFGQGPCGHPEGSGEWSDAAEGPLHDILLAGRKNLGIWHSDENLGYNFRREAFWSQMLQSVKDLGIETVDTTITAARKQENGVILESAGGEINAKLVIYAGGVRGDDRLPGELGIGQPPVVHGIFTNYEFDGIWNSPELNVLFNLDLVPTGYFWCAYARKSKMVSIGILNESSQVDPSTLRKFTNAGIIPELKEAPATFQLESGTLGAVSHVKSSGWPVKLTSDRVINVGESSGMIASYIYEGIFSARYEGMTAARVMSRILEEGNDADPTATRSYEELVDKLNDYVLHISRQQHHAMYHCGSNSRITIESYLKGLKAENKHIINALREQYLRFSNYSRFELGLFKAIISNVPFLNKLSVTGSLISARMKK
ncbi:hypothetical protein GF325_14260 [Candidatus Bathyarchaeota archaeon]|nr:hypothetical protein [Candidatus Bathyarchaeota archaeon]